MTPPKKINSNNNSPNTVKPQTYQHSSSTHQQQPTSGAQLGNKQNQQSSNQQNPQNSNNRNQRPSGSNVQQSSERVYVSLIFLQTIYFLFI